MAPSLARRLPLLGLTVACLAVLPVLRDAPGAPGTLQAIYVVAGAAGALLAALALTAQFLTRGTASPLLLAQAFLGTAVLIGAQGLRGHGATDAWLWAVGHAALPAGLAVALWGGPGALRRRVASPTSSRALTAAVALGLAALAAGGAAIAALAAGDALPALTDGAGVSMLGAVAGTVVLAVDLLALVVIARRGRRSLLEHALLPVAACAVAGTALTVAAAHRQTVGWYAAEALDLAAIAIVLGTAVAGIGRLGGRLRGTGAGDGAGAQDPLTGVRTREATLAAAEHLHATRAPGTPLGLAMIDVDGLRAIGDRHGPLAADAVLLTVSRRLLGQLRDVDVLGRAGDEGFLVVLPGTDADGVTLAIDRAVHAIRAQAVGTWAHDVRATASGGIAMVGEGEDAVAAALAAADLALNQAKAHGRDQVVSPTRAQVVPLRRADAGPPRG